MVLLDLRALNRTAALLGVEGGVSGNIAARYAFCTSHVEPANELELAE